MNKKIIIWTFVIVLLVGVVSALECRSIPKDIGCSCERDDECWGYKFNYGFCNPSTKLCDQTTIEMEGIEVVGEAGWDDIRPFPAVISGISSGGVYNIQSGKIKVIVPVDYSEHGYYDRVELDNSFMFQWEYNPSKTGLSLEFDDYFYNVILECKNLGVLVNSFTKGYGAISTETVRKKYSDFKSDDSNLLENYYPGISEKRVFVDTLNPGSNLCEFSVYVIGKKFRDSQYQKITDADDSVIFYMNVPNLLSFKEQTKEETPTGEITPPEEPKEEIVGGIDADNAGEIDFGESCNAGGMFGGPLANVGIWDKKIPNLCVDSTERYWPAKMSKTCMCEPLYNLHFCGDDSPSDVVTAFGFDFEFMDEELVNEEQVQFSLGEDVENAIRSYYSSGVSLAATNDYINIPDYNINFKFKYSLDWNIGPYREIKGNIIVPPDFFNKYGGPLINDKTGPSDLTQYLHGSPCDLAGTFVDEENGMSGDFFIYKRPDNKWEVLLKNKNGINNLFYVDTKSIDILEVAPYIERLPAPSKEEKYPFCKAWADLKVPKRFDKEKRDLEWVKIFNSCQGGILGFLKTLV